MNDVWIVSVGYGRWPVSSRWAKRVNVLEMHDVPCLVDVRHDACASNLDPRNTYGPRDWHLQVAGGMRRDYASSISTVGGWWSSAIHRSATLRWRRFGGIKDVVS